MGSPREVVFLHGFLSDRSVWKRLSDLMALEESLTDIRQHFFEYETRLVEPNPLRAMPDINALADLLATFLRQRLERDSRTVLVGHSQGGIVVQRFLLRHVISATAEAFPLSKISSVVLFACPNRGSPIFLNTRRRLFGNRNPQESRLRPFDQEMEEVHRQVVVRLALDAQKPPDDRIPFHVYCGSEDAVVPRMSALGDFPAIATLPGDHSSIIQPEARDSLVFSALKEILESRDTQQVFPDERTLTVKFEDLVQYGDQRRNHGAETDHTSTSSYWPIPWGSMEIELPPLGVGEAALVQLNGYELGKALLLTSTTTVLGRDATADLFIDRRSISRRHAEFTRTTVGKWRIEDLNSLNGALVNGKPVAGPQILSNKDVLQLGEAWFLFVTAEGAYKDLLSPDLPRA